MYHRILSFLICLGLSFAIISPISALEETLCDLREYTCYQAYVKRCTEPSLPWMKSPDLGKVSGVDYPEFTLPAIEANIARLATEDTNNATNYRA